MKKYTKILLFYNVTQFHLDEMLLKFLFNQSFENGKRWVAEGMTNHVIKPISFTNKYNIE